MSATQQSIDYARTAAAAAADKMGENIVGLDVSAQLVLTDVFLLVSASNERQVRAIVDGVEEQLLKQHAVKRARREGHGSGRWVLLDFNDIIVHVFHAEDREFYALERLWRDCPIVDLQLADATSAPATSPANSGDDEE